MWPMTPCADQKKKTCRQAWELTTGGPFAVKHLFHAVNQRNTLHCTIWSAPAISTLPMNMALKQEQEEYVPLASIPIPWEDIVLAINQGDTSKLIRQVQ
jgi:hypothetical protein